MSENNSANIQGGLHVAGYLGDGDDTKKKRKLKPMEKVNLFVRDNIPSLKQTKVEVKYQDEWNGTQRCGRCSHFKAGPAALTENCDVVDGKVSSEGWCLLFDQRDSYQAQKDIVNPVVHTFGKEWQKQMMQKAGARHSKIDQDDLQTIHDKTVKLGARCDGHDAFNGMKTEKRVTDAKILKCDETHGVVLGWAIISKVNGEDYFDLNINPITKESEPENFDEDGLFKAALDFMMNTERAGNEMHGGPEKGTFAFAFPMTTEIAKAYGIKTSVTGLMVAYKPPPEVFAKFVDGTYKGFSVEGRRITVQELAS